MEKHLNVLNQALNKANKEGAFTLQESAMVANSLAVVVQALQPAKANPIEQAREEARSRNKVLESIESAVKEPQSEKVVEAGKAEEEAPEKE